MILATLILTLVATTGPNGAEAETPTILDFTASWCGPCQQMRPAVERLVTKGYPVKAVDFDSSRKLVERYNISAVPTFVAVSPDGRELGRISGYRPAADIAELYHSARAKMARSAPRDENEEAIDLPSEEAPRKVRQISSTDEPRFDTKNPNPWQTVVRIKVSNGRLIEFGSGTIISSTADESIILTCAHIFRVNEHGPQIPPARFNLPIEIDLFDGQLHGQDPAVVHPVQTVRGEAIDYDFSGDVGLIRIRPGKRLPASPVVPADWTPQVNVKMTTVGCSEGRDATAWSTWITKPLVRGLAQYPSYEATECAYAPKQGRSGGGLYTLDGQVAGVCDFAEPSEGHGLYASPRTIHRFLDKNDLTFCYAPGGNRPTDRPGSMVAQNRTPTRGGSAPLKVRAQNGSDSDPKPKRLTIPTPDQLNIASLGDVEGQSRPRSAWVPETDRSLSANDVTRGSNGGKIRNTSVPSYPTRDDMAERDETARGARTTEMKKPTADTLDPFDDAPREKAPAKVAARDSAGSSAKAKMWRPAK